MEEEIDFTPFLVSRPYPQRSDNDVTSGNHLRDSKDFERTADLMSSSPSKSLENSQSNTANLNHSGGNPSHKTGIRELDKKINEGDLTAWDYYKAKNLGIDLRVYMQGDFNHKVANTSKATQGVYDTLKALELGDSIINKAQDNSGVLNGMSRWLNEKSGGLWSLDHDLAQTDNLVTNYAYSVARSLGNGKTNLEQQKDAKNMTAFRAKSKEENTSRMAQNQDINLTFLRNQIAELEALGGRVSPELYDKVQEYERKIDYINSKNGKIDLKEYNAIRGDYGKYFHQKAITQQGGDDEIIRRKRT